LALRRKSEDPRLGIRYPKRYQPNPRSEAYLHHQLIPRAVSSINPMMQPLHGAASNVARIRAATLLPAVGRS
jgi:hypothetical protein